MTPRKSVFVVCHAIMLVVAGTNSRSHGAEPSVLKRRLEKFSVDSTQLVDIPNELDKRGIAVSCELIHVQKPTTSQEHDDKKETGRSLSSDIRTHTDFRITPFVGNKRVKLRVADKTVKEVLEEIYGPFGFQVCEDRGIINIIPRESVQMSSTYPLNRRISLKAKKNITASDLVGEIQRASGVSFEFDASHRRVGGPPSISLTEQRDVTIRELLNKMTRLFGARRWMCIVLIFDTGKGLSKAKFMASVSLQ